MKMKFIIALVLALCLTPAALAAGTLKLPAALEVIKTEAFMGIESADEVVVQEGALEIQSRAFANSYIKAITLPKSLTYIAEDAFTDSKLKTVNAPKGSYAYNWAVNHGYNAVDPDAPVEQPPTEFASVKITGDAYILYPGETITWTVDTTSTAKKTYRICGNRSSNVITSGSFTGNTVSFTPEKAMTYWIDLSFVEGNTKYSGSAYINAVDPVENAAPASDFTYTIRGSSNKYAAISAYNGTETDLIVPSVIDGCPVQVVSLKGNTSVQSVLLPVVTSYIPDDAYNGCISLHSVEITAGSADTLQNNTDHIGNDAFSGCVSLVSLKIPDPENIHQIGAFAFKGCIGMTEFVIPENVTRIYNYTFAGCTNLRTVKIPASVTQIDNNCFDYCPNLTLLVEKGSAAETYAVNNNIPYEYFS